MTIECKRERLEDDRSAFEVPARGVGQVLRLSSGAQGS